MISEVVRLSILPSLNSENSFSIRRALRRIELALVAYWHRRLRAIIEKGFLAEVSRADIRCALGPQPNS